MSAPVVLITGAARRIGAEITHTFHRKGFDVALHYNHSAQDADTLAQELNVTRKDSAATFQADLTDISAVKSMATHVLQWRNTLKVLINNASSFYPTPLDSANEEQWDALIGSNLKGPYFLCQSFAKKLQESQGSIINIADIYAKNPLQDYSIYCIAKAGNVMLTKSLAKELAPKVRVNGIAPGVILWPNTEEQMSDTTKHSVINNVPLGRTGSPADIAQLAFFLATRASYTTGQIIAVDGGSSLCR
ncbi:MAG: pteridine reductase [Porticoccus sp.]